MGYQKDYLYQEITVASLDEIYRAIGEYKEFYQLPRPGRNGDDPLLNVFYRGQSNKQWDISPSLERSKVNEADQITAYSLEDGLSLFGMIAYIQHNYTGTRFIDFTMNPDVAIYFACSENSDKDGAVFIYSYDPHKEEWYTAIVLSELTQIPTNDIITIEDLSTVILRKHPEFHEKFQSITDLNGAIVSFLDHGFMALPDENSKQGNIRLQRQEGCFFVCGVKFVDEEINRFFSRAGENRFYPHSAVVPDSLINGHTLVKLIIPKDCKEEMLKQVYAKGIIQDYLFPKE